MRPERILDSCRVGEKVFWISGGWSKEKGGLEQGMVELGAGVTGAGVEQGVESELLCEAEVKLRGRSKGVL